MRKYAVKPPRKVIDPGAQQVPTTDLTLVITQVKSIIGGLENQRLTLRALGLRKIRQSVERPDTPQIRGMIRTVRHLVTVEEVQPS